ncbi:MAG: hypothetical protein MI743_03635 [Sneathiellales bacterium]|nr:hypothetical protein [Sneathiellales bacterium]
MKTVTLILTAGIILGASSLAYARGGDAGDCRDCENSSYFPESEVETVANETKRDDDQELSKRDCEMVDLENGTGKKICLDGRL